MLLVSGANGNLARSVIANLLRMTDPGNILVTTRDPASAIISDASSPQRIPHDPARR